MHEGESEMERNARVAECKRDEKGRKKERGRRQALNGTSEKKKDEKPSAQNIETLYTSLFDRMERENTLSYR